MSKLKLPKGFKIEIEDKPDSHHMISWTLTAVLFQWKTITTKRFLRKPVTRTGWHRLIERRVGSNFLNERDLAEFTRDCMVEIEARA